MAGHSIDVGFFDVRHSSVFTIASRSAQAIRRDVVLLALMTIAAWCGISLTLVGALATAMINDLAVPTGFEGLIQSSFFVGSLAAALAGGWLGRRFGVRRVGLAAISVGVVGALLTGVPIFWVVVAGRLLAGASLAGTIIFCGSVFARGYVSRHVTLLAIFHTIFGGAAAAALLFARPIATLAGGWGGTFWMLGLIGLLPLAVLATLALPGLDEETPKADAESPAGLVGGRFGRDDSDSLTLRDILSNQSFLATAAVIVAYVAAEQACTLFIASFAEHAFGWSASGAAQLAALFWGGIIVGRLLSAKLTRWVAADKQVTIGSAVMGAAIVMLALIEVRELVIPWVFLAGFAGGPIVPLAFARCAEMVGGKSKALVASTCTIACFIGGAIGPIVMSLVAQHRSLADGFWLIGGVMVTAVALVHRSDAKA
jgi:fucose permease